METFRVFCILVFLTDYPSIWMIFYIFWIYVTVIQFNPQQTAA